MLEVTDGIMNYQGFIKVGFSGMNGEFALTTVDLINKYVKINTRNKHPQDSFGDKICASVSVFNHRGEPIYVKSFIGNANYGDTEEAFQLRKDLKLFFTI